MVVQFTASLEQHTQDLPLTEQDRLLLDQEALKLGGAQAPAQLEPAAKAKVEVVIDQSFVDAFRLMMGLCGILAFVSAAVSVATISNKITHFDEAKEPVSEPDLAMPLEARRNGAAPALKCTLSTSTEARKGVSS